MRMRVQCSSGHNLALFGILLLAPAIIFKLLLVLLRQSLTGLEAVCEGRHHRNPCHPNHPCVVSTLYCQRVSQLWSLKIFQVSFSLTSALIVLLVVLNGMLSNIRASFSLLLTCCHAANAALLPSLFSVSTVYIL